MRQLIDKLTLLESTLDLLKVSDFFIAWQDQIDLPVVFQFPYTMPGKNQEAMFNMSYITNKDTGVLMYKKNRIWMKFVDQDFANNLNQIEFFELSDRIEDFTRYDLSLDENSTIRIAVKKTLLNMGFSNAAAVEFSYRISTSGGEVMINTTQILNFFREVKSAYEWRQINIGDL